MSTSDTSSLWRTIVEAIDFIQDRAINARSIESLFALLAEMAETEKSLVARENFAIVYQAYGAERPEFWVTATEVRRRESNDLGRTINPESNREPANDFPADHSVITDVIKRGERLHLSTRQACTDKGLPADYQSFLVVPMCLNKEKNRNIGAFILFSKTQEQAFTDELAEVMDVFSNRFAYFIRHNVRKRRNAAMQMIQNHLFNQPFRVRDCELLDEFVQALQDWFEHDEIVTLLKHPLQTDKFMLACCRRSEDPNDAKLHSIADFRLQPVLTDDEVRAYLGDTLDELQKKPICLNTRVEIEARGIKQDCQSWLAAPMRFMTDENKRVVNLGYIVLYNKKAEFAFDVDEDQFVDALSDSVAMMLGNLRNERFQSAIKKIKDFELTGHEEKDLQPLYKVVTEELKQLYGVQDLHVFRYERNKLDLKLVHQPTQAYEITAELEKEIKKITQDNANVKKIGPKKLTIDEGLFIAPMRTDHRSIGCLLFKAAHIGDFTAASIDDIADELAEKINAHDRERRYELLNEFGRRFSETDISFDKIISLTHEYIGKVMFTDNLYIALYDKEKNEVSFPFALKDGKDWEGIKDSRRLLDASKKGKTEEIILTGEPILHYTEEESKAWYEEEGKNRQEKAGDYLAAWVGVPIFSEKGVIGVIAAYHPTLGYVYSERDEFFLQNIAHQVSGLFRALELEKAIQNNTELKKAQQKIAEQQHILSTSLLAQDLTHRMHNSIGALSININQAISDIKEAQDTGDTSFFKFTVESLEDSQEMVNQLLRSVHEVSDDTQNNIDLVELLKKISHQVWTVKRLAEYDIELRITINEGKDHFITAHNRTLFNALYAIIDNAAYALLNYKSQRNDLHLSIDLYRNTQQVIIIFTDNGRPITPEIESKLFEYGQSDKGSSGFGLWRAKSILKSLEGDIQFCKQGDKKLFTVTLPSPYSVSKVSRVALILDDERSWRNILSRWLSEDGYETQLASNPAEMDELILRAQSEEQQPSYVFLDISMNEADGANADGLTLIRKVRTDLPMSKVIIVTGYTSLAKEYQDQYDLLIPKVSDTGNVLSKETLLELIKI